MHSDMASAGILAKDDWPEIPAGIAIAGKIITSESGPQRRRRQHRMIVQGRRRQTRGRSRLHCRASGGK